MFFTTICLWTCVLKLISELLYLSWDSVPKGFSEREGERDRETGGGRLLFTVLQNIKQMVLSFDWVFKTPTANTEFCLDTKSVWKSRPDIIHSSFCFVGASDLQRKSNYRNKRERQIPWKIMKRNISHTQFFFKTWNPKKKKKIQKKKKKNTGKKNTSRWTSPVPVSHCSPPWCVIICIP